MGPRSDRPASAPPTGPGKLPGTPRRPPATSTPVKDPASRTAPTPAIKKEPGSKAGGTSVVKIIQRAAKAPMSKAAALAAVQAIQAPVVAAGGSRDQLSDDSDVQFVEPEDSAPESASKVKAPAAIKSKKRPARAPVPKSAALSAVQAIKAPAPLFRYSTEPEVYAADPEDSIR